MNISLTPESEQFIQSQLSSGKYASATELILEGIKLLQDRGNLQAIATTIDQITRNSEYGITGFKDGVILLQRQVASDPSAVKLWQAFRQEIEPILQQPV